jgi:Fic family protein
MSIKVAWLQWAFLRIHPIDDDGNGRVSRIICSIPLCQLDLPPVAAHHDQEFNPQCDTRYFSPFTTSELGTTSRLMNEERFDIDSVSPTLLIAYAVNPP